tara:strand:- start:331 stop:654 length:324 start_codon:yes stop_codon:yes gene_type:complete
MKLKNLVKESKYLKRKFGEPLPTLDSVMKQHQEGILKEAPKDKSKAAKLTQRLIRNEAKLRDTMKQLMKLYSGDEVNRPLSQKIESAYKSGVTQFMRRAISILKKVN